MTSRQIQIVVGLLIVFVIGVGLVWLADSNRKKIAEKMEAEKAAALVQAEKQAEAEKQRAAAEKAETAAESAAAKPSFDVARFEPTGDGVLAGLAEPGAVVELLANGEPISSTTANEVGEWVIILDKPLEAGNHDLSVRAAVDGGEPILSEEFIAVVVPDAPSGEVLVVASRPGQASEILSRPSAPAETMEAETMESDDAGADTGEDTSEIEMAAVDRQSAEGREPAEEGATANAESEIAPEQAGTVAESSEGEEPAVAAQDSGSPAGADQDRPAATDTAIDQPATETAAAETMSSDVAETVETAASGQDEATASGEMSEAAVNVETADDGPTAAETAETAAAEASGEAMELAAKPSGEQMADKQMASEPAEGQVEPTESQVEDATTVEAPAETAEIAEAAIEAPAVAKPEVAAADSPAETGTAPAETEVSDAGDEATGSEAGEQTVTAAAAPSEDTSAEAVPAIAEPVKPVKEVKLALDAVETEGRMVYAAGTGKPGAVVRVYADDNLIGETEANDDGRWLLETSAEIAAGQVVVRADELAEGSADVARRAEVPFFKQADAIALLPTTATASGGASGQAGEITVTAPKSVIIRSGDNLWTISRRTYGRGIRYTTIYQANDDQIRNPHLIYPGQVFVLPEGDSTWTQ